MKNLAIWVEHPYDNDELFNADSALNRDNCLAHFRALKEQIEAAGGLCHTKDVFVTKKIAPDVVLFLDIPQRPVAELISELWTNPNIQKHVVLQECAVIIPRNWDKKRHLEFDKIFTWSNSFVNDKKYIMVYFPQATPAESIPYMEKSKLCTLIAGNKKSKHPLELYSKRREAIRWFERHHPEDFDLYGMGWDVYRFSGCKMLRALNHVGFLTKIMAERFPSYKGSIVKKQDVLRQYKFAICYENARDISGYITEKIFDCFFARCIPIYWGDKNISDYIPQACFIDKRTFGSYEELYVFLTAMSDEQYLRYIENIKKFLHSKQFYPFTVECFAKTILREIIGGA